MISIPRSFVCLLFSLCLHGQQASFTTYGQGCGGRLGMPANVPKILAYGGLPTLGNSAFGITCANLPGNATQCRNYYQYWIAMGISRTTMQGLPLPYRIRDGSLYPMVLGGPACDILCSWEFLHGGAIGGGIGIPIPNDPALIGARIYQQFWIRASEVCTFSIDWLLMTDGGMMTIGL